jgi:hypothetical protein
LHPTSEAHSFAGDFPFYPPFSTLSALSTSPSSSPWFLRRRSLTRSRRRTRQSGGSEADETGAACASSCFSLLCFSFLSPTRPLRSSRISNFLPSVLLQSFVPAPLRLYSLRSFHLPLVISQADLFDLLPFPFPFLGARYPFPSPRRTLVESLRRQPNEASVF